MTGLQDRLPRRTDDRGVSLVELLVYSALLVVVLAVVGSMTYRTVSSQRELRAITEATTRAQVVAASVEAGVRSAAAIKHTLSADGHGGTDELLITRTLTGVAGPGTWTCQGWFYDASAATLYAKRLGASGAATPAITKPTTGPPDSTWQVLSVDLTRAPSGTTVFTPSTTTLPATVRLAFSVAVRTRDPAATRDPVQITTSFTRRPQGATQEGVGSPCFSP